MRVTEPDAEPIAIDLLEFRNVRFKYPSGTDIFLTDCPLSWKPDVIMLLSR